MSDHHQRELETLGRRLEARGYLVAIPVARPPAPRDPVPTEYLPEHIQVWGCPVFLYHSGGGWEARVTWHGGQHWVRRAETLEELEAVALEALRTPERPPGPSWLLVSE